MVSVQNTRPLSGYSHIVSFDLSMKQTGAAVYDIEKNKVVYYKTIVNTDLEARELSLFSLIKEFFDYLIEQNICKSLDALFVVKEQMPAQCGFKTQISTLQTLAKAHAVLDLFLQMNSISVYNDSGVHSVSVKSYFKKLTGHDKVTKEDIQEYLINYYGLEQSADMSLDVSDAIAVIHTLVHVVWNKNILEEIKELKKEIKKLSREAAVKSREDKIKKLENLLLHKK